MGICAKLEEGEATVSSDKHQILDFIASDLMKDTQTVFPMGKEEAIVAGARRANLRLNSYFAQAAWPKAVHDSNIHNFYGAYLAEVIRLDSMCHTFVISLAHERKVDDAALKSLAEALPPNLQEIDISFDSCVNVTDRGLISLAQSIPKSVTKMHLDFLGCKKLTDTSLQELARCLPPGLQALRIDFVSCREIGHAGVQALAKQMPPSLKEFSATLRGTQINRDLTSVKDLRIIAGAPSQGSAISRVVSSGFTLLRSS